MAPEEPPGALFSFCQVLLCWEDVTGLMLPSEIPYTTGSLLYRYLKLKCGAG